LLGKVETERGLVCEPAKLDDEFTAGVEVFDCSVAIGLESGSTKLGVEGKEFGWFLI
jgi:hypothetical protein